MKKIHVLLVVGIFLLILSFFRMQWMDIFSDVAMPEIKNGQLNLQNWHAGDGDVLLLDGEWEFYPSTWLFSGKDESNTSGGKMKLIDVPNGWNSAFQANKTAAFGFGSYRLRIFVNPDEQVNYSLYIPSVRSASEVYINGKLSAGSGEVGMSIDDYRPKNLPYTTTFTPDGGGLIEIVVQAANFQDIRRSGIIRSIKFGSEKAISNQRNLSFFMQIITFLLFLIHGLYAFMLYFLGNRDQKLIYFALFLLSITFMNLLSSDDKIFHLLVQIGYEWDFRLANILGPIAGYSLFKCLDRRLIPYYKIVNTVYFVMNLVFIIIIIFSSPKQIISYIPINGALTMFSIVLTIYVIMRTLYIDLVKNFLLLLSFLAVTHHLVWMTFWRESGISVIHYPFDYIIAVGLFTLIWFKEYFLAHNQTKELAAELQQMNDHKDQFLAHTSHEFKNPLHGIINMSESILVRERELLNKRSIHELEMIVSVGQRMSLLLNDLLDISSLKEGNPRLQKDKVLIQPVVEGVLDMLRHIFDAKQLKIIVDIPEDFPPIFADENRVVQIFYNLLHNAIKFTDTGEIMIQAQINDDQAQISITDTGKGMDADFMKRLFLPYEQLTRAGMIESGFGLGLSISRQLIELHGGKVNVSSLLGKGTTFTFSLPLAPSLADRVQRERSDRYKPTAIHANHLKNTDTNNQHLLTTSDTERLEILVIDDDPINLNVLESILSVDHYKITAVLSGKEALHLIHEKEWSLMITDIMMPDMSGYELTKKVRQHYSMTELPILLLTARKEPKDIQTGFVMGANDYVTKPIERIELLSRVKALTMVKHSAKQQLHLETVWLQAQIQPHFLFNTLNALVSLSMTDVEKMSELLIDFSNFLRSKFQFRHTDGLIPIFEELQIVKSYVNIEQVRFGKRLEVIWEIDKYRGIKVPFLSIQPLVENAINHGLMKRSNGGKVIIKVSVQDNGTTISIIDNGVGMNKEQLQKLLKNKSSTHSSIGLMNTNERIMRHFSAGLDIKSEKDKGTTVSFFVPNHK